MTFDTFGRQLTSGVCRFSAGKGPLFAVVFIPTTQNTINARLSPQRLKVALFQELRLSEGGMRSYQGTYFSRSLMNSDSNGAQLRAF